MSQSTAKRIRKLAEYMDIYDPNAPVEYKEIKHKKMIGFMDMNAKPQMVPVERIQLINTKTFHLKKLNTHYKQGKVKLPSLKQLHAMVAEKNKEKANV